MPTSHAVDRDHRILRFTVSGVLTTPDMLSAIDDAVRDIGAEPGYDVYSDHRGLTTPATPDQVRAVLAHLTALGPVFKSCRWAVVTGQPASFGMMRMMGQLATVIPIDVQVFTEPADAEAWLTEPPTD